MAWSRLGNARRRRLLTCFTSLFSLLIVAWEIHFLKEMDSQQRVMRSVDNEFRQPLRPPVKVSKPSKANSKKATLKAPLVWKDTSADVKKPPPPTYSAQDFVNCTLLQPNDKIYQYGDWDGAPIVVESHKLIFFTIPKVGCTVWKQLFRRMVGYRDWAVDGHPLPHAPKRNGLQYLYDYPPSVADQILRDPSWTRAIFVREPKERLLSAYLDKGRQNAYLQFHCCQSSSTTLLEKLDCAHTKPHMGPMAARDAEEEPFLDFADFLTWAVPACDDPHWRPQAERLDEKYWSNIDFVGHMETMEADARRLLERIGAWDDFGAEGWPQGRIFAGSASSTVHHATDSASKLKEYFTVETEAVADTLTQREYNMPILNFTKPRIAPVAVER